MKFTWLTRKRLNGIRNTAKNKIQELDGGRKDYKVDCIADEFKDWEVSWK